ncbi:hypothetical protein [uncultured Methanobrevibacter sp.]|uniref:hypothetical protein n=1 Tax=uncultured Methanobrevibacter sp. TaxID=253161 RepID=UPI0025F8459E|nr:hypothetical protein [uncultured Methanobrevibacter sp.]
MTREEIRNYCQEIRNRTVIGPYDLRLYDLRYEAIRLENKYLYNSTDNYEFLTNLQKLEDIRFKYHSVSFCLVFSAEKAPNHLSKLTKLLTNKTVDYYQSELLNYMFSVKTHPVD